MEYIIISIGVILILLILYICFENKHLSICEYVITNSKIPQTFDGAVFVVMADLHNNSFGKNNERLLKYIYRINPDYIVIAGDMLVGDKTYTHETALSLLLTLAKKYPIYYGYGNHEQRIHEQGPHHHEEFYDFYNQLEKAGVTFLVNARVDIVKGKDKIRITGIEIDKMYFRKMEKRTMPLEHLKDLVGICDESCYNILVAHNPNYFETYARWGADLTLSGHVHGGMARIPFLGGVISPQFTLFPKYDGGKFEINKKIMLLSRGLGSHTIKIRFNNPPELVVFRLEKR